MLSSSRAAWATATLVRMGLKGRSRREAGLVSSPLHADLHLWGVAVDCAWRIGRTGRRLTVSDAWALEISSAAERAFNRTIGGCTFIV